MDFKDFSIDSWLNRSFDCSCGQHHSIAIKQVKIGEQALESAADYCAAEGYKQILLVADKRTLEAAGDNLKHELIERNLHVSLCVLDDNDQGEVVADEQAIVQVLLAATEQTDAIIAVGSGTIHDIVRFASHKSKCVFISVPTAPSVDGFSSVGAPLLIKGFKQTIPACSPEAIFADLNILAAAPQAMVAAGFGDMLGKYTSLADWQLGHTLFQEHLCPLAADMTLHGLELCIDNLEEIERQTLEGMQKLMEGLILSGISMLITDNSRPASGGEHHLSHYWEMKLIQEHRKAILHGAKVGVAAIKMAALYESLETLSKQELTDRLSGESPVSAAEDRESIQEAYGSIAGQVWKENQLEAEDSTGEPSDTGNRILSNWEAIMQIAQKVPSAEQMTEWLQRAGGPTQHDEIGIEAALVEEALKHALFVRNRFTIMRLLRWL
jgi:glycerol-1-phosphate dehydrogenase [NAD(P)+]